MSSVFTSAISSKSNLWSSLYDWTLLTPLPFALPTTGVRLAPLKQPCVPNPSLMCIQTRLAQSNACFWTAADSVKPHLYECKATSQQMSFKWNHIAWTKRMHQFNLCSCSTYSCSIKAAQLTAAQLKLRKLQLLNQSFPTYSCSINAAQSKLLNQCCSIEAAQPTGAQPIAAQSKLFNLQRLNLQLPDLQLLKQIFSINAAQPTAAQPTASWPAAAQSNLLS